MLLSMQSLEMLLMTIFSFIRYFGQPNTPYNFNSVDLNDTKKALRQLSEKHESMRKKINVKVMNMIDK